MPLAIKVLAPPSTHRQVPSTEDTPEQPVWCLLESSSRTRHASTGSVMRMDENKMTISQSDESERASVSLKEHLLDAAELLEVAELMADPIRIIGTNRWPLESHAMQRTYRRHAHHRPTKIKELDELHIRTRGPVIIDGDELIAGRRERV